MYNIDITAIDLIIGLAKRFERFQAEELRKLDFKMSCHNLLKPLYERDGVMQLELSKRTGLKPPSVSSMLHQIELEGYVRRSVDPQDGRSTRVYLTQKGREIEEKLCSAEKSIKESFLKDLSDDERKMLTEILSHVNESIVSSSMVSAKK